jgi:hypothetical protein
MRNLLRRRSLGKNPRERSPFSIFEINPGDS